MLGSVLHSSVLVHTSFAAALACHLARKLETPLLPATHVAGVLRDVYAECPDLLEAAAADLHAVRDRDPACTRFSQVLLHFKGWSALQTHRVTHHLWRCGRRALALALQARVSEALHVDIHPAAAIGRGVLLDHATGVVIGETAVIGDNVSILHHVTLGGAGDACGGRRRHPVVGHGVLLGAGVIALGAVILGAGCKVGAGSVVVTDLPDHCVAVGVPARIMRRGARDPVLTMDQTAEFLYEYVI